MLAAEKQTRPECSSVSDLACTRCRERKIRCDRERPQCSNCKREEGVTCVYQNPAKRVNHLKMLCDSVEELQARLYSIESHLGRLSDTISQGMNPNETSPAMLSQRSAKSVGGDIEDNNHSGNKGDELADDNDDDNGQGDNDNDNNDDNENASSSGTTSSPRIYCADFQVFRDYADMVERYYGPSSLFVLCNYFRLRVSAAHSGASALQDILQNLCQMAGATEPFPFPYSEHTALSLLPKQQAVTAVGHFLEHVDCTTDIFVPRNLMANLDRVYSQPEARPGDDVWTICFRVITLLVLGMEISNQAPTLLVGDFTRSLLPSRAALVSSRLLTTARLINVQTLVLLSVAAQQFDPPGWAELIMTHACILARTMGLHHAEVCVGDADETVERAKVLKSLYIRDKSLCTARGSVSWLPSGDSNIASHLRAAVTCQAPHAENLQLAIIQDGIGRVARCDPHRPSRPSKKKQSELQALEQQLDEFANVQLAHCQGRPLVYLEFLSTRVLVMKQGSDARHIQQLQLDARLSCVLLLIAAGNSSSELIDAFKALKRRTADAPQTEGVPPTADNTFGNLLDFFSVPAFFVLGGLLLDSPTEADSALGSLSDLDLLHRVSACYDERTARTQANSYHRKVSLIFNQLLAILDILRNNQLNLPGLVPAASNSSSTHSPSIQPSFLGSNNSTESQRELLNISYWQTPSASTSTSLDNWLSIPLSLGLPGGTNMENMSGAASPDALAQFLPSQDFPDFFSDQMQWDISSLESHVSRKRPRMQNGQEVSTDKNVAMPVSGLLAPTEELPFYLIS